MNGSLRKEGGVLAGIPVQKKAGRCPKSGEGLLGPALKRLLEDKLALLGLAIIVAVVIVGLMAPYLAPNDPEKVVLTQKLVPPFQGISTGNRPSRTVSSLSSHLWDSGFFEHGGHCFGDNYAYQYSGWYHFRLCGWAHRQFNYENN